MKLILKRICTRQLTTDGVLTSEDGLRICDTAEYTPTMLSEGTYTVKLRMHPKYKHRAPYVQHPSSQASGDKVGTTSSGASSKGSSQSSGGKAGASGSNGSRGFLIHGNGVHTKDFGASIILGDHLMPGVVIKSRPYFDRLVKRIEKAMLRKQEVTLTICH